jgi:hypothetical protein
MAKRLDVFATVFGDYLAFARRNCALLGTISFVHAIDLGQALRTKTVLLAHPPVQCG